MSGRPALAVLKGWGGVHQGRSVVYRPKNVEDVGAALRDASDRGLSVAHRGAGYSYGDLAVNEGGAVIETRGLRGIVAFDPVVGEVRAYAGTTIEELWGETLGDGWWPAVVPGTTKVTLGGALAVNIHGKNHWATGSFAEHVSAVTVLGGDGELQTLTASSDKRAFSRVVGGLGLSGTILDVTLRLQRVHSGLLEVETMAAGSLAETLEVLEAGGHAWTHAVGWIDCFPRGGRAGRGVLHFAADLPADHARAGAAMTAAGQRLPERVLGLVPRRHVWVALRALLHDAGTRVLNVGRYATARTRLRRRSFEPHALFHFLLDSVPGWKRAYHPHGLVQYQLFVPRAAASYALAEALRLQATTGVHAYLGVVKRHRGDPFPNSYMMDGFSLALDFPVRPLRLDRLVRLFRSYDALLSEVGGSIYAAKDGVSRGRLPEFRHRLFSSNLVRRWEGTA